MMELHYLDASSLRNFFEGAFCACGVDAGDAATAASTLFYADLSGLDTHGAANLERIYMPQLLDGRIDATAKPEIAAEYSGIAVIDAHNALGLVVGVRAIDLAIAKARQFGVGAVAVRNSSHCGSVGAYTIRATRAGMIGLGFTNMGPQGILRPLNGSKKMLGTNVISAAAPAGTFPPFRLDMSTAVVSTGQIRKAQRQGRLIPSGWLVDDAGQPVTDPWAYETGKAHLQFVGGQAATGGAKGYGLALLADILCGVLSGAGFGAHRPRANEGSRVDNNTGHFFLALDVARFRGEDIFRSDMDEMLGTILDCPSMSQCKKVVYPGYNECHAEASRSSDGIPVDGELLASLRRVAERLDIEIPREVIQR